MAGPLQATRQSDSITNRAPVNGDVQTVAAQILSETRIGNGTNATHRVDFIEAALDKIADANPALAAAVRAEIVRGLSVTDQGRMERDALIRGEPGITRDAGNGQTVPFAANSNISQEQWIAEARAGGYRDYAIYAQLAGSNDNAAILRTIDDVYHGRITPSQFAAAGAAVDDQSWTDNIGAFLSRFSPTGLAMEAAQPAIASLARDAGIGNTPWGARLLTVLDTPGSMRAFNEGLSTGMVEGAKEFVVGIATLAGKTVQFVGDNSIIGTAGDALRSVVPDSVKGWLRDMGVAGGLNQVLPSEKRGAANAEAIGKIGSAVASYFGSRSSDQIGADIKKGIDKIWSGVQADHAKAAAKGPGAEARWWGALVGRVTFEVAATFVPIAGQAGKGAAVVRGADAATDLARVANPAADALRVGEKVDDVAAAASASSALGRIGTRFARVGKNEVTWTLDAAGRPIEANATLREVFTGLKRSSAETKAQREVGGSARLATDEGGHIMGHRFVKDQGIANMFPQNANLNKGAFKTVENELADWIRSGAEVRVKVVLKEADGGRPDRIVVSYDVINPKTGEIVFDNSKQFRNVANETFNRVAKKDMAALLK